MAYVIVMAVLSLILIALVGTIVYFVVKAIKKRGGKNAKK